MILAADTFRTNADLMRACIDLGYIKKGDRILDPTYGKGTWWKGVDESVLLGLKAHNRDAEIEAFGVGTDFRDLPYPRHMFDVAVFDPPYVAVGGRATSTIGDFNDAYGLVDVPLSVDDLATLINLGLDELCCVVKPRGLILFKCMNYVSGGKYRTQAYDALDYATSRCGCKLVDEFIHLRRPGPQPARDRQCHARRNYSHLFVLETSK